MILTNPKLWVAQFELTANLDAMRVGLRCRAEPNLRFGGLYKNISEPGLVESVFEYKGFAAFGTGSIDEIITARLNVSDIPVAATPAGGAFGDVVYFMKAAHTKYAFGAEVGKSVKCDISTVGTGLGIQAEQVRGKIFEPGTTSRTTSGNSSVIQLGAVGSTQSVFAQIHVLAFSGSPITIKLRSAATNFGSPTDRITFNVDAAGASFATPVAGAITDTYWRFDWSGGTFTAAAFAGIQ